jgi:hypothetical protein
MVINNSEEFIELLQNSENTGDESTDSDKIFKETRCDPSRRDSNINKITFGNVCIVFTLLITNFLKYIDRFTIAG